MTKRLTTLTALLALSVLSFAQERQPRGTAETMVGGKKVVIDYGRPALKGRELGDLMEGLGDDRIWRAGENQVTTLETAGAIKIGGESIPAGKYSLYVYAPTEGAWALCVNKHMGVPLGEMYAQAPPELQKAPWPELRGYAKIADQEVARIPMQKKEGKNTDVFTIDLGDGALTMAWGNLAWATSISD